MTPSADDGTKRFRFAWIASMKTLLRLLIPLAAVAVGTGALSFSGGCGSKTPPPGPSTVRGKVLFNGQPVVGGLVVFTPNPLRGGSGKPVRGETGTDGTFQLQLDNSTQVPPGWYRVSLAPPPVIRDPVVMTRSPVFPAKLARPDLSGLEREVQAGKNHVFEFAVEVPAP